MKKERQDGIKICDDLRSLRGLAPTVKENELIKRVVLEAVEIINDLIKENDELRLMNKGHEAFHKSIHKSAFGKKK